MQVPGAVDVGSGREGEGTAGERGLPGQLDNVGQDPLLWQVPIMA
jgi:hypothetical protein